MAQGRRSVADGYVGLCYFSNDTAYDIVDGRDGHGTKGGRRSFDTERTEKPLLRDMRFDDRSIIRYF